MSDMLAKRVIAGVAVAWLVGVVAAGCSSSGDGGKTVDPGNDQGGSGGAAGNGGNGGNGGMAGSQGGKAGGASGAAGTGGVDAGTDDASMVVVDAGADGSRGDTGGVVATDAAPPVAGTLPAGFVCVPGAVYGAPLPANPVATLIKGGYGIAEGPVWIAAQKALYFSDFQGTGTMGRIQKYTPANGMIVVFVDNVGTNGMAVDGQGQLVAASHDMQRLTRFDPVTGQRSQVEGSAMYMGKPFNSVNDVVARTDGNMYFSDPDYQLGLRTGQGVTAYYRLSPAGQVTRIGMHAQPNGIALSPDGKFLYVSSSEMAPMRRFPVADDGSVTGAGTVFSNLGSDGMAIDCAGNLYITTNGNVIVLSPAGQMIGMVTGFGGGTTNAAFGGDDRTTLFVTGGGKLYQIKLNVPGLPN